MVVVDELGHGGVGSADRALGVLAQLELAEAHGERVDEKQAADERFALAEDELDDFRGLDGADHAGQDAENAALGAAWHEAGRRWLGIEAAVAGAFFGGEDGCLALEAEDAAVGIGLLEQDAGVVDEVARLEVVRAVGDDVVLREDFKRVGAGEHGVVLDDVESGIQRIELFLRGVDLFAAHVPGAVDDLTLEVAGVHDVEIDEAESADSSRGEIEREGRTEAAGADAKDFGCLEALLAFHAYFGKDEVSGVAAKFVVGELGQCFGFGCRGGHSWFP